MRQVCAVAAIRAIARYDVQEDCAMVKAGVNKLLPILLETNIHDVELQVSL